MPITGCGSDGDDGARFFPPWTPICGGKLVGEKGGAGIHTLRLLTIQFVEEVSRGDAIRVCRPVPGQRGRDLLAVTHRLTG